MSATIDLTGDKDDDGDDEDDAYDYDDNYEDDQENAISSMFSICTTLSAGGKLCRIH